MGDAMSLFLVLVRACSSLTVQIAKEGLPSPLLPSKSRSATTEPHLEVMERRLQDAPALPLEDVNDGIASLELIERQCSFAAFQRHMFELMKSLLERIHDPYEGNDIETDVISCDSVRTHLLIDLLAYCHFIGIYNVFGSMSSEDFATFIDETNCASVVLQAHFMALEALLEPWLMIEVRTDTAPQSGLTALPSSATLTGSGLTEDLWRWPLRILGKKTKHSHTT